MPTHTQPLDIRGALADHAVDRVAAVNQGALALMRRCGVELHEAHFLLDASGGAVEAAMELHTSCALFTGRPAMLGSNGSGCGSLTAASHMALAHASPPSSMPESPADLLVVDDDGGMDSSQWPTVSSAAAASEDWDVVDPFLSNDGDEWVEVDDPDAEEEDEDVKPSFKDMIQLGDASKGARCAAVAGATQPRFVSAKAAASKECGQQGWQRLPAPESTSLFDFDEDMHELKVHRKRDGHSKNSQKGCRRMAKTKQARALKNSSRR